VARRDAVMASRTITAPLNCLDGRLWVRNCSQNVRSFHFCREMEDVALIERVVRPRFGWPRPEAEGKIMSAQFMKRIFTSVFLLLKSVEFRFSN